MDRETRYRYQAIDRCLAYCVFTAYDAGQVYKKIRTPFPVYSKRRIILMAALISLLIAAAAGAAGILWRQGVEQTAVLYQQYGTEAYWSMAEYEKAIEILADIGFDLSDLPDIGGMDEALACKTLDQYLLEKIPGETDSLHERLVDYHGSSNMWSVEEKAWYSGICEKYGLTHRRGMIYFMPGDGEMPVDQAAALAKQKLMDYYDISLSELERYPMSAAYFVYENAPETKYWKFSFVDPTVEDGKTMYAVTFFADGSNMEDGYYRVKTEQEKSEYAERWRRREIKYLDMENPYVDWTPEYLEKWNAAAKQYGSRLTWPLNVKADLYGDDIPAKDMITPDEALSSARAYLTEADFSTSNLYPNVRYREAYGYMIWFYPDAYGDEKFIYFTTVNAVTGECEGIHEGT